MNKSVHKRPLAEEPPLTEVINRHHDRREFKTARMMVAGQMQAQQNPLFLNGPQQPVDVMVVAPVPAAAPIILEAQLPVPTPKPPTSHDHLIAHIQSKHWQFWGHLTPQQQDMNMQSWTPKPTSTEVQVLKGHGFLIRQPGPNARNALGSKVVTMVCKFYEATMATDCFVPIKMCPYDQKIFTTEMAHAEAIAANNALLLPMILVVRADLQFQQHSIREILGAYVSTKNAFSKMPHLWILKNDQILEFTQQSALQFLTEGNSIKSQLGAKALSPNSAEKFKKRIFESSRTPSSSSELSPPELKRSETDDDVTMSRSNSLEKGLKKVKVKSQPTQSKKKSSQQASGDPKQKSLMSFFAARPIADHDVKDVAPDENEGNQHDHCSPDI